MKPVRLLVPKKLPRSGVAVAAQHRHAGKLHDRRAPRGNPRSAAKHSSLQGW